MDYVIDTQYLTHTGHRWKFDGGFTYLVHGGDNKAMIVVKALKYIDANLGEAEMEYPVSVMTLREHDAKFGHTQYDKVLNYEDL